MLSAPVFPVWWALCLLQRLGAGALGGAAWLRVVVSARQKGAIVKLILAMGIVCAF